MKELALILSKTQMNNGQVCMGGLTWSGRHIRLFDKQENYLPRSVDLAPRQIWEIEFIERKNNKLPHVEDILVLNIGQRESLEDKISVKEFLESKNISIWRGHPDELFDKLIQWTPTGKGYIDENGGVPSHSVGFWISDKDLKRYDYKGVRYQYNSRIGWRNIKYKGIEESVPVIPAGTLLRVSLARWKTFNDEEQPKCWLQLSGWYDLGNRSD